MAKSLPLKLRTINGVIILIYSTFCYNNTGAINNLFFDFLLTTEVTESTEAFIRKRVISVASVFSVVERF